jgi:hypothetical protein
MSKQVESERMGKIAANRESLSLDLFLDRICAGILSL